MLKTAYYAAQNGDDLILHRYSPDSRAFEGVNWPAALEPVRTRLMRTLPNMSPIVSAQNPASRGH